MQVLHDPGACPPSSDGCVVTIGAYDGVHMGHRHLINQVRSMARDLGCASAVVTFDRHPAVVVRPESAPKLLTDLDQKLDLLAETGLDYTLVVHFDKTRSEESAEEFVKDVLVQCLAAQAVVVGHDFHFGHRRQGNVALLQRMGAEYGFDVHGLRLVPDPRGGEPVSSTAIRQCLADGHVEEAAALLGRSHEVRGVVRRGDGRGRLLGFPTANVAVPDEICLPADGIYAGWYERADGTVHQSAISLGRRPTFYRDAEASLLEAHLLDFEGDLYDEGVRVRFAHRLRGERRFDSVDALVDQMRADVAATRAVLSAPSVG
jgi:riboflavin kinase/FMN adenylyltransferase